MTIYFVKVILVKEKGGWGFPRGKLADGESEEECAIREVKEEIGFGIFYSQKYIALFENGVI
jgi:mRNA-decapping enzyme subunit 2